MCSWIWEIVSEEEFQNQRFAVPEPQFLKNESFLKKGYFIGWVIGLRGAWVVRESMAKEFTAVALNCCVHGTADPATKVIYHFNDVKT